MPFTSRPRECLVGSIGIFSLIAVGCAHQAPSATQSAAAETPAPIVVAPADLAVEADAKQVLTYLSSDELEGRGVGTKGINLAADFIAHRFESLGLKTVPGNDGYFQPFEYSVAPTIESATNISIDNRTLELNKSFRPLSSSMSGTFDADAVFVGYGISEPDDFHYDDYAGLDVKGKVVVAMRYEPIGPDGNSRLTGGDVTAGSAFLAKAKVAQQHGAIALVFVDPPAMKPATQPSSQPGETEPPVASPWKPTSKPSTQIAGDDVRRREMQRQVRMLNRTRGSRDQLVEFSSIGNTQPSAIPIVQITRHAADEMLADAKASSLLEIEKQIDATAHPASLNLNGVHIRGEVKLDRGASTVKNVMAILPGKGPHADEFVVVGAHYDHLGRGMLGSLAPGSHDIHHGADDNGSGTTSVLELATKLAHAGPLQRSVLFVTFTAEEEGLIGSEHFVTHPPIPLEKIVAMLNLDMVGRLRDETLYVGGSGTAESFEPMLNVADDESPLKLLYVGPLMNKGGMGPSDHQSFAGKKVPVVFFFTGLHRDYHTPTDTVEKINFDGIGQIVSLGEYVVRNMATMPHEPYIAKYDAPEGGMRRGSGLALGFMPDMSNAESTDGVAVQSVRPDTPASRAGLADGDVIVKLNATKIATIYDLTDFLADATPGEAVTIVVERDKKSTELHATLEGKPASRPTTQRATTRRS